MDLDIHIPYTNLEDILEGSAYPNAPNRLSLREDNWTHLKPRLTNWTSWKQREDIVLDMCFKA